MFLFRVRFIYKADAVIIFLLLYNVFALTGLTSVQSLLLTLFFTILAYCLVSSGYRYIGTLILTLCSILWDWIALSVLPLHKLPGIASAAIYVITFIALFSIHDGFESITKDVKKVAKKFQKEDEEDNKKTWNKVNYDTENIDTRLCYDTIIDCYNKIKDRNVSPFTYYFIGAAGTNVMVWMETISVPVEGQQDKYILGRVIVKANLEAPLGPTDMEDFSVDPADPNYKDTIYRKLLEFQEKYYLNYCKVYKGEGEIQGYYNAFVYSMQFIDGVNEHWYAGTKDRTAEKKRQEEAQNEANPNMHEPIEGEELFSGCKDAKSLSKRYHELMKKYHPDNTDGSAEMAQRVQAAYAALKKIY